MSRNLKIDVTRFVALFLMIFLHYWSYQGFNNYIFEGFGMIIKCYLRNVALTCVPLFMIITGYLYCKKEFKDNHAKGLIKIYCIYVMCSVFITIIETVYEGTFNAKNELLELLAFKGSGYAWYVEMYIGLYLLIPILNCAWKNINKKYITLIMFILVVIPQTVNVFSFRGGISFTENYDKIFPEFWTMIYPIAYYYVGCYFYDNIDKIKCKKNGIIMIFVFALSSSLITLISALASYKNSFVWGNWQSYSSVFVFGMSISVFYAFISIKLEIQNEKIIKFFATISEGTYAAYLLTYLFDNSIYRIFHKVLGLDPKNVFSVFVYVPVIYISSCFLGVLITFVYKKFLLYLDR